MTVPNAPADILPDELKHDWRLLDRYQAFSSELLRIALLGIAGIGFLLSRQTTEGFRANAAAPQTAQRITVALVAFGLSAAFALGHRYMSSDSMACYVKFKRLQLLLGAAHDKVVAEQRRRDWRLKGSAGLLLGSTFTLGLGAAALALAFIALLQSAP